MNIKHGMWMKERHLYNVWLSMHQRCYKPNATGYDAYGGRGIKVHKIWHGTPGLLEFIKWAKSNGFSPELQLDREDNDKNYSPNNCRFVTRKENQNNRRNTVFINNPYTGNKIACKDFYREKPRKISYRLFLSRITNGKSVEEALDPYVYGKGIIK